MQGKIALEEHFAFEGTLAGAEFLHGKSAFWPILRRQLLDLHEERIAKMDALGIEYAILSLNAPTAQAMTNKQEAIDLCRRANDYLAEQVAKRPDRLGGFATLPMLDAEAATAELIRSVKDLGFKGGLTNGFSHQVGNPESAVYYDEKQYWPFFEQVEKLDCIFYMHPRDPTASQQLMYTGHPWLLTAAWAFGVETGTHTLRLICSGLFDHYPKLKVLVGHLGEGLTFHRWRIDHCVARDPRGISIKKKPSEYLHSNFYFTTSGNFTDLSLQNAVQEMGADRILFSADYPYEKMEEAAEWFDRAPIGENDRMKIGRTNAIKLLDLKLGTGKGKGAAR
jgi:predicted TIM-barrel fold metal-dependent hydrolase